MFPAQDFFTYEVLNRAQLAAEDTSNDPARLAGLHSAQTSLCGCICCLHKQGTAVDADHRILQAPCSLLRRKALGLPASNALSRSTARPIGKRCPGEEGELAAGVGVVAEATLRATKGVDLVALIEAVSTAMEAIADSVN